MSLLETMRDRRASTYADAEAIAAAVETEKRSFNTEEDAKFLGLLEEVRKIDERIKELDELAVAEARTAAARADTGDVGEQRTTVTNVKEPELYRKGGPDSYFRDLYLSQAYRDNAATQRLQRNAAHATETRALGNTNATGGSGGEWAPPDWLINDWITLIRPGRITADLFRHEDVPFGISSLNYPKLLTGTAVGLQSTQNTALPSTDPTTGFVQVGFSTIGGKNVLSQQIIDQARNFDDVVLSDLAAAYAQQVGTQVFTGTGTGSGTNAVINGLGAATVGSTQTWTQATPTAGGFYGQAAALLAAFLSKRLLPPTHWVMNPRRWYWLAASLDSTGRPLVVPNGNAYNPMATQDPNMPMGMAGTLLGVPVVIDPLTPANLGAGTNQDIVYLLKADDLVLLESTPATEVFRAPYADSLGVLVRLYCYTAAILNRHPESIGVLTGTGLTTPAFGS